VKAIAVFGLALVLAVGIEMALVLILWRHE
jgi:hypothetical protein